MDLCGDQFVENAVGNHYCIFITANYSLKRRNKHTFDTYAFTIDLVPLVSRENVFCRTTSRNKWKRHKNKEIAQSQTHIPEVRKQIKGESPLNYQICAKHRRGHDPSPAQSP
jgi:hypothetical protein